MTGYSVVVAQTESGNAPLQIAALSTDDMSDPMEVFADTTDPEIVRNINTVLGLYEEMINQKKSIEATERYLTSDYIQHNPTLANGGAAVGQSFAYVTSQQQDFRVVVHRIIAYENYVWAHVNFINMLSNDPNDTGVAGVDIFRFTEDGTPIEHWDTLQVVGTPDNAAQWLAPNIPAANSNGMF